MKAKIYLLSLAAASSLAMTSCDGYFSDLKVPNEYDPSIETVMADATQYPSLLTGVSVKFWDSLISYGNDCTMGLGTASDMFTAGAGNWNMTANQYYAGREKAELDNSDASSTIPKGLWFQRYSMINTLKNILVALDGGTKYMNGSDDETYKIYANAYCLMGLAYSELSLMYDQAFPVTEDVDAGEFTGENLLPYTGIRDLALSYLDKCIQICNENGDFSNFDIFPDGKLSSGDKLKKMASFAAARALAYTPRTKAEYSDVDWNKVLSYAKNGIQEDITAEIPNNDFEFYGMTYYATSGGGDWCRVNMRIFAMMCPDDPKAVWPLRQDFLSTDVLPELQSPDARLKTDFLYTGDKGANVDLSGYQRYSPYSLKNRFNEWIRNNYEGTSYLFAKEENDLLLAEAMLNTGDKAGAATIINKTRVTRGNLPAASAGDADLMRKLYYERFIETDLLLTVTGFYDRRRTPIDEFQMSTRSFRQFPVPKVELDNFGLETYTFGGAQDEYPEYKF